MNKEVVVVINSLPEEGKTGTEYRVIIVNQEQLTSAVESNDVDFFIKNNTDYFTKNITKAMTVAAATCKKNNLNTIILTSVNVIFPRTEIKHTVIEESSSDNTVITE